MLKNRFKMSLKLNKRVALGAHFVAFYTYEQPACFEIIYIRRKTCQLSSNRCILFS